VIKAFKYRLYPTVRQREALQFTLDRNCELYNAALEERCEAWRMSRVSISYKMQSAQLPEIKEIKPEYNKIYSHILQDTLVYGLMSVFTVGLCSTVTITPH
jgi:putative transposase